MCNGTYVRNNKRLEIPQKSFNRGLIKNYANLLRERALPVCPGDLTLSMWSTQPKLCTTADLSLGRMPYDLPETPEVGGLQLAASRLFPIQGTCPMGGCHDISCCLLGSDKARGILPCALRIELCHQELHSWKTRLLELRYKGLARHNTTAYLVTEITRIRSIATRNPPAYIVVIWYPPHPF